eukprot:TRINITY_DN14073_c0_g1_i1.p1 TRINITY_DN14073_c0_g1~~TRINITY_DN14073_c0_g1_i1.p1  ORF type:complete len:312 (+),score=48.67 TRINITY_DN14073_c0_g1_i1:192-1127(+)
MPLKLAVFDFDLTLTCHHMFYTLSGSPNSTMPIPPPHPRTERGQLARILQLEQTPQIRQWGGFGHAVFGGRERVIELQKLLQEMTDCGVELMICSKSLVGPLQYCLDQVGLLRFFTRVYGNVGDIYQAVDDDTPELLRSLPPQYERYLGTPAMGQWGSKAKLMRVSIQERRIAPEEALFLDDMPAEVKSCEGVCGTILIDPPRGLTAKELSVMRKLLGPRLRAGSAPSPVNGIYGAAPSPVNGVNPSMVERARGPVRKPVASSHENVSSQFHDGVSDIYSHPELEDDATFAICSHSLFDRMHSKNGDCVVM